jgi:hypothetical protein
MHAWRGWTAAEQAAVNTAPTWEEWCAWQRRLLGSEQRQQARQHGSSPFSDRELARLSFVRWLYQTGCLDLAQHDND